MNKAEKKPSKPSNDEINQDIDLVDSGLYDLQLKKRMLDKQTILKVSLILSGTFIASVLLWLLYAYTPIGGYISEIFFGKYYLSPLFVLLPFWIVVLSFLAKVSYDFLIERNSLVTELELLKKRKRVDEQLGTSIVTKPDNSRDKKKKQQPSNDDITPTSYFNSLVRINIDNLDGYYVLVKAHAQNSYMASISAGIAGFLFILIGLGIGLLGNSNTKTLAFVSSGAGIAIEFISSIFFYLYNKTIRELREYHDSLISVQNILLSFKIVEETKDEKQKAQMMSQMIAFIIGKSSSIEISR